MKLVDQLYAALQEHESLRDHDFVEAPRPAAPPAQLEAVAKELALPPDAVALLAHADGWSGFMTGWVLMGTDELVQAQEDASQTFEDCETEEDVAKAALVIARSENDAGMLFYDLRTRQPDGRMELVEWLYEDKARHAGLEELFAEQLRYEQAGIADERAARAELEEEWTEAWRANETSALREALRIRLAEAELPERLTPERIAALPAPHGELPASASLDPASLDPASLDADDAKLCLSLLLHLRGAPSPDEVRRIVAIFRAHFPEPAFPEVARFSWPCGRPATLATGDPVLEEAIGHPARAGAFGLSVTLNSKEGPPRFRFVRSLAVPDPVLEIQVQGPLRRTSSASCIDVKLPLGTEPARLRALAIELAGAVPFVSGYASYGAVASGIPGVTKVYDWSRRFLGIDVRDARLELGALHDSVKNAAWLTLLGDALADSLRARFGDGALSFDSPDVVVTSAAHGVVIEAGQLSVGDVQAAEFPFAVAEVDRRISPLRLRGFRNDELLAIGGVRFVSTYTAYDGPFGDGSATHDWLERWTAPERHLGLTPIEEGEAFLRAIDAAAGTDGLVAWQARRAKSRFSDLLHHLTVVVHGHEAKDECVAALEWAGRFSEHPQGLVLLKLFYGLLRRGDVERARPYLGLVAAASRREKALLHNAACIAARLGDRALALAFLSAAKESGYQGFPSMQRDSDLTSLAGDPEFDALFA
jgi:Protein of unknown function (DUF3396)